MNKIALLIGINDYSKVNKLRNLTGCNNDLTYMEHILRNCYGVTQIVILNDKNATSINIKKNIESMFSMLSENDQMLLYFTGHGSQIISKMDELDGLDEVFCPYDMNWKDNFISDNYLNQVISSKLNPKASLEVIIDTCFSGGMMKGNETNLNFRSKFLEMPLKFQPKFEPENILNQNINRLGTQLKNSSNLSFWFSCSENELSGQGFNSFARCDISYFTYSFCRNIQNHNGSVSRQALLALIHQDFSRIPQTPHLFIENQKLLNNLFN